MTAVGDRHEGAVAANEARHPEGPRLARVDADDAAGAPAGPRPRARRLRIVHCLDGFGVGGTELNAVRTLERLDRARFELTLVSLTPDGPLRERFERAGIPIRIEAISSMYAPATVRRALQLASWLRRERIDVVHCHDMYTNLFGVASARLAGVPLVIASRRWWDELPGRLYGPTNRLSYRHAAHRVLANSEAVGRLVVEEGTPRGKVVVVPNFVDDAAFDPLPDETRRAALAGFGVPADALVVGAVAMLRPEKDLVTLVRAVARLVPEHPRLHLLLVGEGSCDAELRRAAAELGIADHVHFAGYQPGLPNPHGYLDVSVLCSLHEGFPNTIIEAMAAARPVVATNVGGVADAVAHDRTGLLVGPARPDALAAAIGRLAGDAELRRRFGAAGRERAGTSFRSTAVLERLASLYDTVPVPSTRPPRS